MKRMFGNVGSIALHMLVWMVSLIPFGVMYVVSDMLYYPFYYIVRYRRQTVRRNLTESFPEKEMDEIRKIEKDFYHYFVDIMLESTKLMTITPEEMRLRMRFEGIDYVNQLLAQGKSISLFLGHYGNWEWVSSMGMGIVADVVKAQVYRRLGNHAVDNLMRYMRGRFGHICVEMNSTARFVNRVAMDGKPCIIGFLADQSPRKREVRHYVTFLSHNVPVHIGTERITRLYHYEAVFLSMKRLRRGYYVCELALLHDNPASLPEHELTRLYYDRLEKEIEGEPSMYLWSHKRFKYARIAEGSNRGCCQV